jgi:hypothetical protein
MEAMGHTQFVALFQHSALGMLMFCEQQVGMDKECTEDVQCVG